MKIKKSKLKKAIRHLVLESMDVAAKIKKLAISGKTPDQKKMALMQAYNLAKSLMPVLIKQGEFDDIIPMLMPAIAESIKSKISEFYIYPKYKTHSIQEMQSGAGEDYPNPIPYAYVAWPMPNAYHMFGDFEKDSWRQTTEMTNEEQLRAFNVAVEEMKKLGAKFNEMHEPEGYNMFSGAAYGSIGKYDFVIYGESKGVGNEKRGQHLWIKIGPKGEFR